MTIKKIGFDVLSLQVTRRCNLSCKHCSCGDAEDMDMTKETIDNVLEQTYDIGTLIFTGGEPLLNDDIIIYTLDEIMKRKIRCYSFDMDTNGLILKEDLCDVLNEFALYCSQYNTKDNLIALGVSADKYHDNNPCEALTFYKKRLKLRSYVFLDDSADRMLLRVGRAAELKDVKLYNLPSYKPRPIVLLEYGEKPSCTSSQHKIEKPDQVIAICPTTITANGNICADYIKNFKWQDMNVNIAGNVNDKSSSIYDKIKAYNKGKPNCFGILDDGNTIPILELYSNPLEMLYSGIKYQKAMRGMDKKNQEMLEFEGLEDMHSQYPKLTRKECIVLKNSLKHVTEEYLGEDIINKHRTIIRDLEKLNDQRSRSFGSILNRILS
ncbi:radical SAM protein [Sinanaerobacter chloroacetimidivorans]|uniref:Radical SAM protein n=1 Tax=Sinanaerobacter chloroacetimidivorans TaxID=2818044 RepID=A0A8J8B1C3_9FIRM|nr:radical SAM protein [Sinanaerobacter chloroacetimidivorans]MBR0598104.1 radical SAM protein [Sinanaerobacter chloroacetimidivorans]